jgi:Tol biopolymer transport system component
MLQRRPLAVVLRSLCALAVGTLGASAQITTRPSVDSSGAQGSGASIYPSISSDGRYIAFVSAATNLVPGDTNGVQDAFVHDRVTGATTRVSVDSGGAQGNGTTVLASISSDGRYVIFESGATNLVAGDTNGVPDMFVHDMVSGSTVRVSVDSNGVQANSGSELGVISSDGHFVAFTSFATNLVSGSTNSNGDVFVHDMVSGATTRVSVDSNGAQADNGSFSPSLSSDGRYVAFMSWATNLVSGDTNGASDVFLHDRQTGLTTRISVDSAAVQGNGNSDWPSISADGRFVAFYSSASNLVASDTNASSDVFVHDLQTGATTRVSVDSSGIQGNWNSYFPAISSDGRCVAFSSIASNLVPGDTNAFSDVYVHDLISGATTRVSVDSGGAQGNGNSTDASISSDGRFVAFDGSASNFVQGDTNNVQDVFLRDRSADGFTSSCDPGAGGVIACPCSNPPGASGRGCDNSSGTGGASLAASGVAYLSMDSLVFTTSGERSTAFSILLQGTTSPAAGLVYGQGVRCVGGSLKRLYSKAASGGSITAPSFGAGDPPVSVRSAAQGDMIQPGTSRWYLVYYRDPNVLGGCPASSTFNATQTGRIDWSP